MMNNRWLKSIYSDGTEYFVSSITPALGEDVSVRIRFAQNAPVEKVLLRLIRNGGPVLIRMEQEQIPGDAFVYYKAAFCMTQQRMQYQFYLISGAKTYYYNQCGVFTVPQDRMHDFVLLSDYHAPSWLKDAVFYQIFPERFCNGNPSLSVKDGEYTVNGFPTMQVKDWNTPAGTYEECHCVDFYGGDLEGIIQKIPYLKNLGINAVYLNPIFEAPSVHKYDCIDFLHVDPHFGGDEALAKLTAALHAEQMHLVLDISINHTGTAHRWFNRDLLYFPENVGAFHNPESPERSYYVIHEDQTYECWDGVPDLPKLNFRSDELRGALYRDNTSVLKKWLQPPYSIDGWRFDVADVMANYNEYQLAGEVWPEIRESIRNENPDAYILAENWDDCTEYLQGDCWDAPMNYYGFGRIIRQFYGAPDAYMERDEVMARSTSGLSAEDFRARAEEYLARLPLALRDNQYNLFDSHDIGRLHTYPGVTDAMMRGAITAMFTMPGVPSVYYADEASVDGRVGYFEGGRFPMPWDSGFENTDRFKLYRELAFLRKEHAALREGGFAFLYAEGGIVCFARFDMKEAFLTVFSSEKEAREITIDLDILGNVCGAAVKNNDVGECAAEGGSDAENTYALGKDVLGSELSAAIEYDSETGAAALCLTCEPEAAYLIRLEM